MYNVRWLDNTITKNTITRVIGHPAVHIPFPFLIFQIGFNKAGTECLYKFFKRNDIPSIHRAGEVHSQIMEAFNAKNGCLMNYYVKDDANKKMVFTDFGITVHTSDYNKLYDICMRCDTFENRSAKCEYLFPILDGQYANSKFILNIRDFNHWLPSKFFCAHCKRRNGLTWHNNGYSLNDIVFRLKYVYYSYHCDVINYFKDRPNDLLIYDIENDTQQI
eukprot:UN03896